MEIRNLRHVVALANRMNYMQAGEDLGLSQSALTRSIQATERKVGLRLFDRDRSGVRLTPQGRLFVERAQTLIAGMDDLDKTMEQTASAEQGEVSFGIEPLPARALLHGVLSTSLTRSPRLKTRVLIRSIEALWEMLVSGDIEFFISAQKRLPWNPPPKVTRLGTFPLSLLVRSGHPALDKRQAPAAYPVLLAGDAGQFEYLPASLRTLVSGPRHIVEDYGLLGRLTEDSDAILIASTYAVAQEINEGRIRELLPTEDYEPADIQIAMYSLERRSLSPGALKLRSDFQQQMLSLTRGYAKTP
ncbi:MULTISPECIES: LysR family transcriptional regulator [unclassified Novosphingobium]|uniref:LysR family transcriptional regulator n=1 Tax=unclassified Novosphingobium TaxID=2644732 RepID=UPI0013596B63|nr:MULTISPECIES: LysR family transcriptional regulator [unclassified Novosphingobium]